MAICEGKAASLDLTLPASRTGEIRFIVSATQSAILLWQPEEDFSSENLCLHDIQLNYKWGDLAPPRDTWQGLESCLIAGAAKHLAVLRTGPTTQHYSPKNIDSARSKNCVRDDYWLVLILMSLELCLSYLGHT